MLTLTFTDPNGELQIIEITHLQNLKEFAALCLHSTKGDAATVAEAYRMIILVGRNFANNSKSPN